MVVRILSTVSEVKSGNESKILRVRRHRSKLPAWRGVMRGVGAGVALGVGKTWHKRADFWYKVSQAFHDIEYDRSDKEQATPPNSSLNSLKLTNFDLVRNLT